MFKTIQLRKVEGNLVEIFIDKITMVEKFSSGSSGIFFNDWCIEVREHISEVFSLIRETIEEEEEST